MSQARDYWLSFMTHVVLIMCAALVVIGVVGVAISLIVTKYSASDKASGRSESS